MGLRAWLLPEHPQQPRHRIVVPADDSFLQRDDRVIGDVDMLRADVRAVLRDVAVPDTVMVFQRRNPIRGIERMHLERGAVDEEPRSDEFLVLVVLAQNAL